jgi:GNAT superfamily N-acetyltransferase
MASTEEDERAAGGRAEEEMAVELDAPAGGADGSLLSVRIRPFVPGDSAAVAAIWVSGLRQTVDSISGIKSLLMRRAMEWLERDATSAGGDVGPDGANLAAHWFSQDGREMLVATLVGSEDDVVVGCCGVIRGADERKPAPDGSDVCSVWRVSVAESARRRGVGTALMGAAEDWARARGACRMRLVTGNPVAATFYVDGMGYERPGWRWDRMLPRYVMWFEKNFE